MIDGQWKNHKGLERGGGNTTIIKPWLYALKKLVQARNAPPRESLEVCRAKALERLRVGYLNEV